MPTQPQRVRIREKHKWKVTVKQQTKSQNLTHGAGHSTVDSIYNQVKTAKDKRISVFAFHEFTADLQQNLQQKHFQASSSEHIQECLL